MGKNYGEALEMYGANESTNAERQLVDPPGHCVLKLTNISERGQPCKMPVGT